MSEIRPQETDGGVGGTQTSSGQGDNQAFVSDTEKEVVLKLAQKELKRDVKTYEEALKVIKESHSYAGKLGSENASLKERLKKLEMMTDGGKAVADEIHALKKQMNVTIFYQEHPELKDHKEIVNTFSLKYGGNLNEVLNDESFNGMFTKISEHDKLVKSKSVLESNMRLGQVSDTLGEAKQAMQKGDMATAQAKALDAVMKHEIG